MNFEELLRNPQSRYVPYSYSTVNVLWYAPVPRKSWWGNGVTCGSEFQYEVHTCTWHQDAPKALI
ncbi:hypothetical protein ACRALDRAFT_207085 [Sodiomyces alcalophilus JCM 7366]|uniref:uncharacterized protein n=1 Tax=Sodiomyces alcalophilus JCM 7366 TaxID=591952 RepID=UPI0039B52033